MKNIFNKTNAPYLVSGALAIGTLLASGIFAVAPYIGFLAPVAALSLGLPFIVGGAVFSAAVIALSAVVINKNGAIRKQSALLHEEAKKAAEKDTQLARQAEEIKSKNNTISKKDAQLAKKDGEISNLIKQLYGKDAQLANQAKEIEDKKKENSELKGQVTNLGQTIANQAERINEKDHGVRRMQCELAAIERSSKKQRSIKNAGVQAQECKDSDVHMPSAKSVRNWIPSLKTVGLVTGGAGLLGGGVFAANGGFGAAGNPSNAVVNPVNNIGSHTSIVNSLSTFHRPADQQIMQIQIDEAAKKLADAEEFAKNNFGMPKDANDSEPQWYKDLHKSEDLEEIMEDVPSLFCEDGNSNDYQFAKSNFTESTHTKSSKTVGSNQTVVAGHSSVDISGTCPANYETSLAKRNTDDACPIENNSSTLFTRIWNKLPFISSSNPFGSCEHRISNVTGSDYQFAKSNFQASTEVGNKAVRRNHSISAEFNYDACPAKSLDDILISSSTPSMTIGS